jgi:hypothetical protein
MEETTDSHDELKQMRFLQTLKAMATRLLIFIEKRQEGYRS